MTEAQAPYEVQLAALSRPDAGEMATLYDLEEASYKLVCDIGEAEWKLVVVLAAIRDSGKWQDSHERFDEYLRGWAAEASHRLPRGRGLPMALRVLQQKLALHRRLVEWAGMEPQEVLGQPAYIMDTLCRTLGSWDYKTGAARLTDQARSKLIEQYGEQDDLELVRGAVYDVAHIAIPGEALAFIRESFGPLIQDQAVYEFVVELRYGYPDLRCHVQRFDPSGQAVEDFWCPDLPWPEDAVSQMAKLLGAQVVDRSPAEK